MDHKEQPLTNQPSINTNVPTPPDSTGEKDVNLRATALNSY